MKVLSKWIWFFATPKKVQKSLKMPKSQISGPFPPIENIFFCKKKNSLSFYISKPLKKHWAIWFWELLQFSTLPKLHNRRKTTCQHIPHIGHSSSLFCQFFPLKISSIWSHKNWSYFVSFFAYNSSVCIWSREPSWVVLYICVCVHLG